MIWALVSARLSSILMFTVDSIALAFLLPYLPLEAALRKHESSSGDISFSIKGLGYLAKKASRNSCQVQLQYGSPCGYRLPQTDYYACQSPFKKVFRVTRLEPIAGSDLGAAFY